VRIGAISSSVYTVSSLRFSRLLPPKSPILGDFETGALTQSPPLVGDLGGKDLGDDRSKDLCVHRVTAFGGVFDYQVNNIIQ